MLAWIKQKLAAPIFEGDEDKTREAMLLNTTLLLFLAVLVVGSIAIPFLAANLTITLIVVGLSYVITLLPLFLIRRGRVRFASYFFVAVFWGVMASMVYISGGINGGVTIILFVVVVLAGLLLGRRALLVWAGVSIGYLLLLLFLENAGRLPHIVSPPLVMKWFIFTLTMAWAVIPLYLSARSLSESLERARRSEAETAERNQELQESRAALQHAVIQYGGHMAEISQGNLSNRLVLEDVGEGEDAPLVTLGHQLNSMTDSLQDMARVADYLARGDLTVEVTPQSEQDMLGNAFARMVTNLRNLVGQVQESANQVASVSQQVNDAAEQSGQAGQQVSSGTQQVAEGTSQQTQALTEATQNVEQMARAAEGVARGAQEQALSVQKTSDLITEMDNIVEHVRQVADAAAEASNKVTGSARNGVTAVEQTGQGMTTIRSRTVNAVEKVKEMNFRSQEIGRIVETIDQIADKTDMLALNAAVEAARAGEHGRGFAVVADQVRKLSEDSKSATQDINILIERVQQSVNQAIAAMEGVATEVDNGTQLAQQTTQSLEEILQVAELSADQAVQIGGAVKDLQEKSRGVVAAIETVGAVVEENTASAEQMAANSQEVTEAMAGVAAIAEENSASTEEVSASAEEMSAQIEEMVASAEELAALAEQLRTTTARFQVDQVEPVQVEPVQMEQIAAEQPTASLATVNISPEQWDSVLALLEQANNSDGNSYNK